MLISVHEMTRAGRLSVEAVASLEAHWPRGAFRDRRATGTTLGIYARPSPQCGSLGAPTSLERTIYSASGVLR